MTRKMQVSCGECGRTAAADAAERTRNLRQAEQAEAGGNEQGRPGNKPALLK